MPKPGLLSSELWVVVLAVLNAETDALSSNHRVNGETLIVAAVYVLGRSLVKMSARGGQPSGLLARMWAAIIPTKEPPKT